MKYCSFLLSVLTGVLVLSSSCPKPFSYTVSPQHVSIWTSNGKVSTVSARVSVKRKPGSPQWLWLDPAASFRVWADGRVVWHSETLVPSHEPVDMEVNLAGAKEIILESVSSGFWYDFMNAEACWENVSFKGGKGASIKENRDRKTLLAQLGILTPAPKDEPQFNGADIWGVRPGHPVIFRIPVSGKRPMKFSAPWLPEGVSLDTEKGILTGNAPASEGSYDIEVTAENAFGKASRTIRLEVGQTLALTPPMGWNDWNIFEWLVTEDDIRNAARVMDESGLGDFGWAYVNIDDYWEMNNSEHPGVPKREELYGKGNVIGRSRDDNGKIITNGSFPDMKALTDYIHSFGFKAGLYSSPGRATCSGCEGSYGHEKEDAESWADWGFDYIKYDWCGYQQEFEVMNITSESAHLQECIHPYRLMAGYLKKQKRDILYSVCQYGQNRVYEWARENGAQSYRSWNDLKDEWVWMMDVLKSCDGGQFAKYSGPGCWADLDMMMVGQQISCGSTHPTFLTNNEQYTHVSLWAMISSPLLLGCDLTKLDDFTYSLITNHEVIAINQDRLGKVATRVRNNDTEQIWLRPLSNGDVAVAMVNMYPTVRNVSVSLEELGLEGIYSIKDCWTYAEEGQTCNGISAEIPAHATKLVRLSKVKCPKCQ